MLKENCTIRYASGYYWIVRASKNEDIYTSPILTNETGYLIWKCLKLNYSVSDISAELSMKYKIPYQEALSDIKEFISLLQNYGCIEADSDIDIEYK